ncbi:MAG: sulfopyruvate decarboxylase subunit alpha [Nitrospina sp.]|nr:sulfopyruvate decarboxylase subunit alpha [Nitrospina sp.]MBT3508565.1 sulfopyruvate decarboxylase subunit alpha [Nitrospina sp.]MBT3875341.1 sulfopyruvate decarboxylase subunit alpha [Nitrospina sp.]MBT4048574.1 sulfopyruvate decarboxylase subunit alpha [Nitrospina sp.]MBT4559002.1 sulfopyruvate decarboxylase subunit alpha [Nitrospina sp.]
MSSFTSKTFIDRLIRENFKFFTGVPCSLLSGLISYLEEVEDAKYIPSVREDSAVGLCAGAYLSGSLPVLLMQNSGLGYCLNAFTSLNLIYRIPVLVIMSWRGQGGKDAPEHIIMGDISQKLLETAGMDYAVLKPENCDQVLETALKKINEEKLPYTLLIEKGLFDERH